VLPSDLAWEVILSLAAASLVLVVFLAAYAALQRVRRRPVQVWVVRGTVIALGLLLGFLVLSTNGTETPRLLTTITSAIVLGLVFVSRPRTGGAVLVAIAVPWTIWWASFLADNALAGRHWVVSDVVGALIPGVAAILAGSGAFFLFGNAESARHQTRPVDLAERKFGAAGTAFLGPRIFGLATYELACTLVLFVFALGTAALIRGRSAVEAAVIAMIGILVIWAVTCAVWVVARRRSDRRLWEAYSWLGEWELDRYRALAGGPALPTRQDFQKWLKASPDRPEIAWMRSELFVMEGKFDEARAAAESIPDDTPYGRVEREAALASADWHSGGSGDTGPLAVAVANVAADGGDERLRAEVILAAAEVRRLLAAGDPDPVRPMRAMRDRLGGRPDGILWVVIRRRLWPKLLQTATFVVIVFAGLDRLIQLV
jgi:hypothetical protein